MYHANKDLETLQCLVKHGALCLQELLYWLVLIEGLICNILSKRNRLGVFTEAENIQEFVKAVHILYSNPEECVQMGKRGRCYILETSNSGSWNSVNILALLNLLLGTKFTVFITFTLAVDNVC